MQTQAQTTTTPSLLISIHESHFMLTHSIDSSSLQYQATIQSSFSRITIIVRFNRSLCTRIVTLIPPYLSGPKLHYSQIHPYPICFTHKLRTPRGSSNLYGSKLRSNHIIKKQSAFAKLAPHRIFRGGSTTVRLRELTFYFPTQAASAEAQARDLFVPPTHISSRTKNKFIALSTIGLLGVMKVSLNLNIQHQTIFRSSYAQSKFPIMDTHTKGATPFKLSPVY